MIAEKSAKGVGLKTRRGINPTETTLVSVPLQGHGTKSLDEGGRLADIMLHKLATGEPLRDEALLDTLKKRGADPFLQLYAAALFVADRSETDLATRRNDAQRLLQLLGDANLPDATCIRWRLDPTVTTGALDFPPMLDVCWRWASEHSVCDTLSISQAPALTAAARVTDPTPPWLVWLSAAKTSRKTSDMATQSASDVAQLTRQIVETVLGSVRSSSLNLPEGKLATLSPATVEFANAAMSALSGGNAPDEPEIARRIAYSTGTPSTELAPQLGEALEELRSANAG